MGIIRSDYIPTDAPTMRAVQYQTTDGQTVVHQRNDVTNILQANHFQKSEQTLHHDNEVMNHYARVDVLALKSWCSRRGLTRRWWMELFADGGKLLTEFLNDPENEVWRTRKGKI